MANRSVPAVMNGFNFEVNAAIVLMLQNIENLESVRTEGKFEDVELRLDDGHYIYAQAKAVLNASSDFKHVREYLKAALVSLLEAQEKATEPIDKLILITNSPNPLNDKTTSSVFYGPAIRDYGGLPPKAQGIIKNIIEKSKEPNKAKKPKKPRIPITLDLSLFRIQVVPFESDVYEERYKVVLEVIKRFLGKLSISYNHEELADRLVEIWHFDIMNNGSTSNQSLTVTKKDIVWPVIALITDIEKNNTIHNNYDEGEYREIVRNYRRVINYKSAKFEFVSKIVYDFTHYQTANVGQAKFEEFIEGQWNAYISDFPTKEIPNEIQADIIKATLRTILTQRFDINNIKKGARL